MESSKNVKNFKSTHVAPLLAGACAGLSVTVALYPLDTLKTRLQSQQGLHKSGGFKGIYRGLPVVASASMPMMAVFFGSYETMKNILQPYVPMQYAPFVHMVSACVGEFLACTIKVPADIAKQRKQTSIGKRNRSSIAILVRAYKAEGFAGGVYRGFLSTAARDLPYALLELPAWELLKAAVRRRDGHVTGLQSAMCGSIAGGFAGFLTTPLDVAKTRIMLAEHGTDARKLRIKPVLAGIYRESGVKGLFIGVAPRVSVFMIGSFVGFGVYENMKRFLEKNFETV